MEGLCHCGCGQKTAIAPGTDRPRGRIKGEPARYLVGHNIKGRRGSGSPSWKGGKARTRGYIMVKDHDHPAANGQGYVMEHRLVAERALGHVLPATAVVHHVNEDKTDNRPGNLVICEDRAYHVLLHRRLRALRACGHADWRRCNVCKQWDAPENVQHDDGRSTFHAACPNRHRRERTREPRGARDLHVGNPSSVRTR